MNSMAGYYEPPSNVMHALRDLAHGEPLARWDSRYVSLSAARSEDHVVTRLCKHLGLYPDSQLFFPPEASHTLLYGQRGTGVSTELRRLAADLRASGRFYVVEVDASALLDTTQVYFPDLLLAMARCLVEAIGADTRLRLEPELLTPLWRDLVRITDESEQDGRRGFDWDPDPAGCSLPEMLRLLVGFTEAVKGDAPCRARWRSRVREWPEVLGSVNVLLRSVELAALRAGAGDRVVFLVRGTNRLLGPAPDLFFVHEMERMSKLSTLAIYAAPLEIRYGEGPPLHLGSEVLSPVMLGEAGCAQAGDGRAAMTEMVFKRIDRNLFASKADVGRLVDACGGLPGELLRLLALACEFADEEIDAAAVDQALAQRAAHFRRFLEPDDFFRLARVDVGDMHQSNDLRAQLLLSKIAMLESADGSRRSHPLVRTLEGYQRAFLAL